MKSHWNRLIQKYFIFAVVISNKGYDLTEITYETNKRTNKPKANYFSTAKHEFNVNESVSL